MKQLDNNSSSNLIRSSLYASLWGKKYTLVLVPEHRGNNVTGNYFASSYLLWVVQVSEAYEPLRRFRRKTQESCKENRR